MAASRFSPGSVASSPSSWPAWLIAASGLRISCAIEAVSRPIAASFNCWARSSTSRTSSMKIRNSSPAVEVGRANRALIRDSVPRAESAPAVCALDQPPSPRPLSSHETKAAASSRASTRSARRVPVSWASAARPSISRAARLFARTCVVRSTTITPCSICAMTSRLMASWFCRSRPRVRASCSCCASRELSARSKAVTAKRAAPYTPAWNRSGSDEPRAIERTPASPGSSARPARR